MATIITIDPGLAGTGYAIWNQQWDLMGHGVLTCKSAKNIYQQLHFYGMKIKEVVDDCCSDMMYIEYPAFFQSAKGSVTAAGGGLVKLTILVGYLSAILDIEFRFVEVNKWKGQLPKNVIINRIKAIYPGIQAKTHAWDAIGIGLYIKGEF
jgi:Holliday junction resolvasome RuvABC endonuclease subunit